MKPVTFAETQERVAKARSNPAFALVSPLLKREIKGELFDPENIELALMLLPQEAWDKINEPQVIENDDGTYTTGDDFFDSFEEALARGENLEDVLKQFTAT